MQATTDLTISQQAALQQTPHTHKRHGLLFSRKHFVGMPCQEPLCTAPPLFC